MCAQAIYFGGFGGPQMGPPGMIPHFGMGPPFPMPGFGFGPPPGFFMQPPPGAGPRGGPAGGGGEPQQPGAGQDGRPPYARQQQRQGALVIGANCSGILAPQIRPYAAVPSTLRVLICPLR